MWKKLADILYRQFTLTKTIEEQDKRMAEMRRDIHDLQLAMQRLIFEIERVAFFVYDMSVAQSGLKPKW